MVNDRPSPRSPGSWRKSGEETKFFSRVRQLLNGGVQSDPGWRWLPGSSAWVTPAAVSMLALRESIARLVARHDLAAVDTACRQIMSIDPRRIEDLALAVGDVEALIGSIHQMAEPVAGVRTALDLVPEWRAIRDSRGCYAAFRAW